VFRTIFTFDRVKQVEITLRADDSVSWKRWNYYWSRVNDSRDTSVCCSTGIKDPVTIVKLSTR